jgi:hypothetical protein
MVPWLCCNVSNNQGTKLGNSLSPIPDTNAPWKLIKHDINTKLQKTTKIYNLRAEKKKRKKEKKRKKKKKGKKKNRKKKRKKRNNNYEISIPTALEAVALVEGIGSNKTVWISPMIPSKYGFKSNKINSRYQTMRPIVLIYYILGFFDFKEKVEYKISFFSFLFRLD